MSQNLLTRLLLVSKPVYYRSCSRISHHPTFLPVGDGMCPLEPGISDDNAEDHSFLESPIAATPVRMKKQGKQSSCASKS